MLNLTQALKARFATTFVVIAALLMLAVSLASQGATSAAGAFGGTPAEHVLPGASGLQIAGGGREISTRLRLDAFRLNAPTHDSLDNDQPLDASGRSVELPRGERSLTPVFAHDSFAQRVSPASFDARGPPA